MIRYLDKVHLARVSLIAAIECNLSCDYCVIAHRKEKNKNNDKDFFKKTVEALKDGTYLNNVKKVYKRLNAPREDVLAFEIWGMEPTLILQYLYPNWKDWYQAFPNLQRIFFSTNGMAFTDDIVSFAKEIDKWAEQDLQLQIQISYDGEYGEDLVRRGSKKLVEDNAYHLIDELNKIKFEHLSVTVFFHGVLSKELMKNFCEDEKNIYNYLKSSDDFLIDLENHCTNRNVEVGSFSAPLELNYIYTVEEGLTSANALKRMAMIESTYLYENPKSHWCGSHGVFGNIVDNLAGAMQIAGYDNLDEYVNDFIKGKPGYWSDHTDFCGSTLYDLKITYDGRSLICQNVIPDLDLEVDPLEQSMEDWAINSMVKNYGATNFLTGSDEEISKTIYWAATMNQNNCYNFMAQTIAIYIYLLASCGQVSASYLYDEQKLLRHSFILAIIGVCYYNNMIETGSNIIYSLSLVRNYCNGLMEIIDEHVNNDLEMHRGCYAEGGDQIENND